MRTAPALSQTEGWFTISNIANNNSIKFLPRLRQVRGEIDCNSSVSCRGRHCEERSDAAISLLADNKGEMASLPFAMTYLRSAQD